MADLDDLENPDDWATPNDVVTAFAPRVERTPGDVWHWLDEEWRAQFEAEFWPALRADEEAGDHAHAVAEVVTKWWARARICAQPGGRSRHAESVRAAQGRSAGTVQRSSTRASRQ